MIAYLKAIYIMWLLTTSNSLGFCPDCGVIIFKRYKWPQIMIHCKCGRSKNNLNGLKQTGYMEVKNSKKLSGILHKVK